MNEAGFTPLPLSSGQTLRLRPVQSPLTLRPLQTGVNTLPPLRPLQTAVNTLPPLRPTISLRPISRGITPLRPVSRGITPLRPISRGITSFQPVSRGITPLPPITRPTISLRPVSRPTISLQPITPRPLQALQPSTVGTSTAPRFTLVPAPTKTVIGDKNVRREGMALSENLDGKEINIGREVEKDTKLETVEAAKQYDKIYDLDDMVYTYPSIEDPHFQSKIGSRLEFLSLVNTGNETVPKRGEFFSHQIFNHRFMQIFPRLVLMHPTGSGKTCSAGGAAEKFRRDFMRGVIDYAEQYMSGTRNQIKHVYILVPGKIVKNEFKRQIICKCSRPGDYDVEKISAGKTGKGVTGRVNRALKSFYTITTYQTMASSINDRNMTDKEIIDTYSDSMFIVDEAHNLRLEKEDEIGLIDDIEEIKKNIGKKFVIYGILQRLFGLIKRSKIVLMTATPMVNSVFDFVYLINLLIPAGQPKIDFRITLDELNSMTVEDLKPYLHGRISYVPDLDININLVEDGFPLQDFLPNRLFFNGVYYDYTTRISAGEMLEEQNIGYSNAASLPAQARARFRLNVRQAANFVFPPAPGESWSLTANYAYGAAGYNKYMEKTGEIRRKNRDYFIQFLKKDQLAHWSIKYSIALNAIEKHDDGKTYCYSDFKTGSGILVFAQCLLANGYERFDSSTSAFAFRGQSRGNYCQEETGKERRIGVEMKKRFALIIGETSDTKQEAIIELYKSWENRHGKYIRTILMTRVAQLGLNLNDTTQIILMEANWNESSSYQAISRAIRAASYENLLKEKRRALLAQGRDPSTARITVHIKRLASIDRQDRSIDIALYKLSEEKAVEMETFMQKAKILSVDCFVHKLRQKSRVPSAKITHLGTQYICQDQAKQPIDSNAYNIMYSEKNVQEAVRFLFELFKINSVYRIEKIFALYLQFGQEFRGKKEIEAGLPDLT